MQRWGLSTDWTSLGRGPSKIVAEELIAHTTVLGTGERRLIIAQFRPSGKPKRLATRWGLRDALIDIQCCTTDL